MATRIDHQETRKLTVYGSIVLQLTSKHPGGGSWRSYDGQFHQQKAADATLPWAELNPSLMAATVLGQGSGVSWLCSLCLGCDHMKNVHCQLWSLQSRVWYHRSSGHISVGKPIAQSHMRRQWDQESATGTTRARVLQLGAALSTSALTVEGQATRQQAVQNPPGQARERPSLLHHSGHRWEGTAELRRDN